MKRVMIIGPCGAGKSTLSHRLAELLDLPLHHLDKLHWKPGWVEGSKQDLRDALSAIIDQERWLIDGNYGGTMELRLTRADTVVYLDYPVWLCLWRAAKRVWQFNGQTRPDMGEDCPERFDWEFFRYIANWNHHARPRTEALLQGTDASILRFESPKALDAWLTELERDR